MVERPPSGTIPDEPGSYQFFDKAGRIIYVGKAKSLRSRVSSYFADPDTLHPRTAQMVQTATAIEWITVRNEVEALMLEFSLIKEHRPRFNVRLVDDKSYPYLAITTGDEFPRAMVTRAKRKPQDRYFGPYGHAYAIRETLDLVLRTFPIRTCSDSKMKRHERLGRPCLLFHIEKCSGPCVDEVTVDEYDELVKKLIKFLQGDTKDVVVQLEADMLSAAESHEFELAARMRDRLDAVQRAAEKQQMVASHNVDADVIGTFGDELETAIAIFYVRNGRVMGRDGFVLDKVMGLDDREVIDRTLEMLYYEEPAVRMAKEVLVPTLPTDPELYGEWISQHRGTRVNIRVPQRGEWRAMAETVTGNAQESFQRHRMKRAADHNSRAKALNELKDSLGLAEAPLRIECYDMSHLQGTDYVGSMVVMTDGLADKRQYRRFKVNTVGGQRIGDSDDFAAMEEVLERRFTAYLKDRELPIEERGKFQYPPQLLVVDGGKGQLTSAVRVLEKLGLDEEIPVCSLAKQFEEVFLPYQRDPVVIPRNSEALYLLQRIRDESHRFAITYHRQLRDKRMTKSVLDDVLGLGTKRKERLVKEMGGINKVKAATLEQFLALSWLPDSVGTAVYEQLHRDN